MVVHHTARLHKGITSGRTQKFKTVFFELFCHFVRKFGGGRDLANVGWVVDEWIFCQAIGRHCP